MYSLLLKMPHPVRSTTSLSLPKILRMSHFLTKNPTSSKILSRFLLLTVCGLGLLINVRRMRTRVTVLSLCVCVCLCVCPLSTSCFKRLYYKMNISAGYTLVSQGFQLTDFSKTFSFKSYSVFTHF